MLTSGGVSRSVLTRSLRCGTRLPVALRPGAGLWGEALLGHQPLTGPLRRGVCRVRVDVAEKRVADDDERQERYHDLPRGDLPVAREEKQLRGSDGRERVHEKQDQGAYRTRRHEQVEGGDAEHQPAERYDDVSTDGDGGRRPRRDAAPGGDGAERGGADLVARERVQQ